MEVKRGCSQSSMVRKTNASCWEILGMARRLARRLACGDHLVDVEEWANRRLPQRMPPMFD